MMLKLDPYLWRKDEKMLTIDVETEKEEERLLKPSTFMWKEEVIVKEYLIWNDDPNSNTFI